MKVGEFFYYSKNSPKAIFSSLASFRVKEKAMSKHAAKHRRKFKTKQDKNVQKKTAKKTF